MKLYTSLVRLKQAMNGGNVPPMTPVSGAALDIIDVGFTIGMGALYEDSELGLRCPVRGCGRWFQNLSAHAARKHTAIGGPDGIRRALSIPMTAPLVSAKYSDSHAAAMHRRIAGGYVPISFVAGDARRRGARSRGNGSSATMGARNLRNTCVAQLSHRLLDLRNKLGRDPSSREFLAEYGGGVYSAAVKTFGTWANFAENCGIGMYRVNRNGQGVESRRQRVLAALSAWHDAHGALPTSNTVRRPSKTPLLPTNLTILLAMKADSWREAMERAASILDIRGGRYGLPERESA